MRPTFRLRSLEPLESVLAPQKQRPKKQNFVRKFKPIHRLVETVTADRFRNYIQEGDTPLLFKRDRNVVAWEGSPVVKKWFVTENEQHGPQGSEYLKGFGDAIVTYEITLTPTVTRFIFSLPPGEVREIISHHVAKNMHAKTYGWDETHFIRFQAPLSLFLAALDFNSKQVHRDNKLTRLYIAQSSISNLPASLQEDLAPPPLVDVDGLYSSSIWLGLTPTYTPLHRDPNPNLFVQLHGSKLVRFMRTKIGHVILQAVRDSINLPPGNPKLRGEEMMVGTEKQALHHAIWTDQGNPMAGERWFYEARLDAGDALYLPTGWWHSLKSVAPDANSRFVVNRGDLNFSANWWFRPTTPKLNPFDEWAGSEK